MGQWNRAAHGEVLSEKVASTAPRQATQKMATGAAETNKKVDGRILGEICTVAMERSAVSTETFSSHECKSIGDLTYGQCFRASPTAWTTSWEQLCRGDYVPSHSNVPEEKEFFSSNSW